MYTLFASGSADISVTAIPHHCSKVCQRIITESLWTESQLMDARIAHIL